MTKFSPFRIRLPRPRIYGVPLKYFVILALLALVPFGSMSLDKSQGLSVQASSNNTKSNQSDDKFFFAECGLGTRLNCVVDGDTVYLDGHKFGLAGIDTPKTHPAQCSHEAQLGARATQRFTELLNGGAFAVRSISGGRNKDQSGRILRTLHRDGQSFGAILIAEGLARKWQGLKLPWCS